MSIDPLLSSELDTSFPPAICCDKLLAAVGILLLNAVVVGAALLFFVVAVVGGDFCSLFRGRRGGPCSYPSNGCCSCCRPFNTLYRSSVRKKAYFWPGPFGPFLMSLSFVSFHPFFRPFFHQLLREKGVTYFRELRGELGAFEDRNGVTAEPDHIVYLVRDGIEGGAGGA